MKLYPSRVVLVAALLAPAFAAAAPRPKLPAKPVDVAIPKQARVRTIKVEIGGKPREMLFDTGGGVTAISPSLAREVGCEPTGTSVGHRMTGEKIETPLCRELALSVGGLAIKTEAAILDITPMLGKGAPPLDGMISLATFEGLAVTVDLAGSRMTLESTASLARRTRTAAEVPFRAATGGSGGQLSPFVGVATHGGLLWFELDSGHNATTFVSPSAAKLLGEGEVDLELAASRKVHVPIVARKDLVHDGVLSAATVARGVWTLDLAANRCWVGPIAPLIELPRAAAGTVTPPVTDPTGVYEVGVGMGDKTAPHVLVVRREGGTLVADMRAIGDDEAVRLVGVTANGAELSAMLPLHPPAPMKIVFEGTSGRGSWGEPKGRGGVVTATKRR